MPAIKYGVGAYRRERGDLPEFELINLFLEQTPAAEAGVVLLSRPPLATASTVGAGPVTGIYSQEGAFNGDVFTVSSQDLYRGTTLIGQVYGTGPVSFASSGTELLITAGGALYSYTGTDYYPVVLPDNFNCKAIAFLSGHFVAIREGSQKFYWSAQLNGRSWDALDFASAESEPDSLVDVVSMRGNLYLMGQATIEPWFYTGDLNLPFSLIQQRLFPKGVIQTGCSVEMDNALFWVASDGIVYRTSDVPERLSDHGIEERIAASASISAFGLILEGHNFFCIRLTTATYAYDAATGQWCRFASFGRTNFRGRCATMQNQIALFGDDVAGKVLKFGSSYAEEVALVREFTAAFPIKGGTATIDSVTVDANTGRTADLAGQGAEPKLEIAASRDAGATWGTYRSTAMGGQGNFRTQARWRRMGMFDFPGGMFKFRFTDPTSLRVSAVLVNEEGGGRSRGT